MVASSRWPPEDAPASGVAAIVLAAGSSSRLGEPKQLLLLDGETLLHRAVRLAQEAGCPTVVVVTGALDEALRAAVADLAPVVVRNTEWSAGMGISIKTGLAALPAETAAVLVLTTDQPQVSAELLRELVARWRATSALAVASVYADTRGIPALFDQQVFAELRRLPAAQGAKPLLAALGEAVGEVPFPDGAVDLDTPAQVAAWRVAQSSI